MGRHAAGWKLESRRGVYYVRFTHARRQHLISTGKRDLGEAGEEAARLYSRVVAGGVAHPASTRALVLAPLTSLFAEWLASLIGTLDEQTIETYETTYVGRHWLAHYDSIESMCNEAARERYRTARLAKATAKTVKKEVWAQDKFLRWCKALKIIHTVPPRLVWESTTVGTRTGKQRETPPELSVEQVEAILSALPAWKETGHRALRAKPYPIRARFVVAYETGLRPETMNSILWGDWRGKTLVIRNADDKVRFGREVPLSERAQVELAQLREQCAARGVDHGDTYLVFGRHEYRARLLKAAASAGLDDVAPYDLRHARGTHLADAGAALTGIGFILGHRQATTTNRYVHVSRKAAEAALATTPFLGGSEPVPRMP